MQTGFASAYVKSCLTIMSLKIKIVLKENKIKPAEPKSLFFIMADNA